MEKIVVGFALALVFGLLAAFNFSRAEYFAGIPVRSVVALQDIKPGVAVVAYGGVYTGKQAGLSVYVAETEHCTTSTRTDEDGKIHTSESCSWRESSRTTPPFTLVMTGQNNHGTVSVANSDYRLTGSNRYIKTGYRTRLRGFQNGDGVLIVGTSTKYGIRAVEVYGGTLEQYIGGYTAAGWVFVVLAVVCAVGGIVFAMVGD